MRPTIVRGMHIPTQTGHGRSYKPVRDFMRYLAYGRYIERLARLVEPRGAWRDQAGNTHSQQAVEQWAKEKVHRLRYDHAYQLLLSTGKGGLDSADFNTALRAGSAVSHVHEWRMMTHNDTNNLHTHVILFRHEPLSKKEYLAWQQTMQQALDKQQIERTLTLQHEQSLTQTHSNGWEMTQ